MSEGHDGQAHAIEKSTRDRGELRQRLQRWLGAQLPSGAGLEISQLSSPTASGMSSETLLFDAHWNEAGRRAGGPFVARLAPDPADKPTFPTYDMSMQYRVMKLVGEHSKVPVPTVRWLELDPQHLGCSFFVMERLEGRVPSDNPPYAAAGWLKEASVAERSALRENTIAAIAALHAIDLEKVDTAFLEFDLPGDSALRRHVANQRAYYDWIRQDGPRIELIERTFDWLDANWPEDEGPPVLSWGDSRIGNVMYAEDGFAPVAVLDWEMAALAPRGADLGWLVFMHDFFEDLLRPAGVETLPDLLPGRVVRESYERASGHALPDFDFYRAYGGLRHAIIMSRITARGVHFGQSEWPEDPSDAVPHRPFLERVLSDGDWRS